MTTAPLGIGITGVTYEMTDAVINAFGDVMSSGSNAMSELLLGALGGAMLTAKEMFDQAMGELGNVTKRGLGGQSAALAASKAIAIIEALINAGMYELALELAEACADILQVAVDNIPNSGGGYRADKTQALLDYVLFELIPYIQSLLAEGS